MNRMDYLHRKSRGRVLNESVLNEAVYRMDDVREMWYKKVRMLKDPRKQINLHSKLSKIEPEARNEMLARILLYNFPGTSGGFINQIITSTFGDSEWLDILNSRFGTDVTMQYLKDNFDKLHGPELSQKTLQIIGKKEDSYIKMIESGRGNVKSEDVVKVAQSTKRTYIAGSFEEVYNLVTTRNDFQGRYEKNPDGTISINMAEIPLTMIRAMYGLKVIDDSQPLVYIVFGPVGGNDKAIKDHAKQELDLFLRNSHDEKELQEMHIGYYDLRPCGLEYWWTNVSKRFVSKRDDEAADNVRNSNATITISSDGDCILMVNGEESELEMDPAVNPGNSPVTVPIEDEYGFDTVKESKNNDIRMNRFRKNWNSLFEGYDSLFEEETPEERKAVVAQITKSIAREFYNKGYYLSFGNINEIKKDIEEYLTKYNYTLERLINYFKDPRNISERVAMHKEFFEYQDKGNLGGFGKLKDREPKAVSEFEKYLGIEWKGATPEMEEEAKRVIYEVRVQLYNKGWYVASSMALEWKKDLIKEFVKYINKKGGYPINYYRDPRKISELVASKLENYAGVGADYGYSANGNFYELRKLSPEEREQYKQSLRLHESNYAGRYNPLLEGKALTSEEKMDRWHEGTRKENIKACNIDKLKEYRKICRAKGYTEEVKQINAEINRRKKEGINESDTNFLRRRNLNESANNKNTIKYLQDVYTTLEKIIYVDYNALEESTDITRQLNKVKREVSIALDMLQR